MKSRLTEYFHALLGAAVVAALLLGGVTPAAAATKPASITSVGPDYGLSETVSTGNLVLGPDGRTAYFPTSDGSGTLDLETKGRGPSIISGKVFDKFVLSQDGKTIYAKTRLAAGIDAISTGPELTARKALPDTKYDYRDFAVSPDGKMLVTIVGYPRSLVVAETATGELVKTSFLKGDQDMSKLWFSPDGRFLYITGPCDLNACTKLEYSISVVDTSTWETIRSIPSRNDVKEMIFSPDGKKVYVANGDGEIAVIETQTGQLTKKL